MNRTTIRLKPYLLAAIQTKAEAEGRSVSNVIRHILNHEFGFPDSQKLNPKQNPRLPLK